MSAISDIQHNQQTELSMLRCRLAPDWSEIVKIMSYSDFFHIVHCSSYYSLQLGEYGLKRHQNKYFFGKGVLYSTEKIFSTLIEPLVGLQILKIPLFDSYYASQSVLGEALSPGCLAQVVCVVAEKKLESKNYVQCQKLSKTNFSCSMLCTGQAWFTCP